MSCVACGSEAPRDEFLEVTATDGKVWRYARCESCRLLSLDPIPTAEEIAAFYAQTAYGTGDTKFPKWLEPVRKGSARRRAKKVNRTLGRAGRILDLGCGAGTFLEAMGKLGHEIHGTELEGPAFDRAAAVPDLQLVSDELSAGCFPEKTFDVITIWHVLEHLPDPQYTLSCCQRFLKEDGLLIVEVPNAASWQGRLFAKHWLHLDPPRHLHQFNPVALERALERAGFSVVDRAGLSIQMGSFGFLQSALNLVVRPRELLYQLLLSRGRFPVSPWRKAWTVLLALPIAPVAVVFALAENVAGAGAVCRYRSRLQPV
jgi:2-polyprenyl-3-methyl-5-hydroxy-6-metoxy-1,4-benzoquinol methylase